MQMAAEAVLGVPFAKVQLNRPGYGRNPEFRQRLGIPYDVHGRECYQGGGGTGAGKWRNEERPAVATYQYRPPATTPYDPETGKSEPNFAYGYVAEAVEVEVDIETGHIRLVRVICADDVGHAVNPQLVQGQIEGAVVQAQGYAIMENLISQEGRILNPYLSTYLIPTILDVPDEVKSVILEYADPIGPWGARGMGEMPFLPLSPAIVAAVHDATGIWMDSIPMTPERVVAALRREGLGIL